MQQIIFHIIAVTLMAIAVGGCGQEPPAKQAAPQIPKLSIIPVRVTIKQRSTSTIPGSDGHLLLTIDDITRNQVMVALAINTGTSLLASRSMSPNDAAKFQFAGASYVLTLKELNNALMGEDSGTFIISSSSGSTITEEAKIERLIQAVADLQEATFIRNSTEHDAKEAADHLRSKWRAKADDIRTAEQFIETIASRSSLSGEPYQIRLPNGRVVQAGEYFRERLNEIEHGR